MIELVRHWLADERLATSRLVLVTRGALATYDGEHVGDLVGAALHGLFRSARAENPGRLVQVDLAPDEPDQAVVAALDAGEDEVAVRAGTVLLPRLVKVSSSTTLAVPAETTAWRLSALRPGTLDGLGLIESPEAVAPLAEGQVRVAVRAAGMNFRDVMSTLGLVRGQEVLGGEAAGVVTEVGPGVVGMAPGDRVMGMFFGPFGPLAVADHQTVVPIPDGWSYLQAATVPITYLTAYFGLVDVAGLQPGESILIHAAAGGVGIAAVQLAAHLGAEIYASSAYRPSASRTRGPRSSSRTCWPPPTAAASTWCSTRSPTSSWTPRCGCCRAAAGSSRWARPTSATPTGPPPPTRVCAIRLSTCSGCRPNGCTRCWSRCSNCSTAAR
jgi:polyketide synthase 12